MKLFVFLAFVTLQSFAMASPNKLIVGTINIGMLDAFDSVSFVNERQDILKVEILKVLNESSIDVLAIQEMFTDEAHEALQDLGSDYELLTTGGDAWVPLFVDHPTGLAFIVKKSLRGKIFFKDFATTESINCGYGHICDKGLLIFTFENNGHKISILNTHLTSSYDKRSYRKRQIDEIQSYQESLFKNDIVNFSILAGDLNISPSFGDFRPGDKGEERDFAENAKLYDLFFAETSPGFECVDTYKTSETKPGFDFTYNRDTNYLPLKNPSSSYEPSQRVDHIFLCAQNPGSRVNSIKLIFNNPIKDPGLGHFIHFSDHYGVLSEISLN